MTIVQTNTDNRQKVSFPRRIATYIASMNFAKVFRRHHPKESSSPVQKSFERPSLIHHYHGYPRPFSYHIPTNEQLSPLSLNITPNIVPYRIGLSSDSTLLTNGQTNENDDIVRLPIKSYRAQSPKMRKDRRYQTQLNANKRWLFRSMETLDGWKEKVFSQKNRTTNSSQSRSRSVENLADKRTAENILINHRPSIIKQQQQQQRTTSPNRNIETITSHAINNIGIQRKPTNLIPNVTRNPALTIKKQSLLNHLSNDHNNLSQQYNNNETNPSAILDFREISSTGFLHSKTRLNDDNENISLTPSENILNSMNISDDENDEITSNLSFLTNAYDHINDSNNETSDPWDFSITWIDSLKEQNSPQRKIQFYENLIKLLEQDTLNIDELLVLRKILAKIWPTNDIKTTDSNNQIFSIESKTHATKSLHNINKIKQRPKLSTMTHHTAQRCSTILEQSQLIYESLHEQNSGHTSKPSSLLLGAKAKPCFIENTNESVSNQKESSNIEQNYPQHLNPFNDETDITPSNESDRNNNNDSIRRYFERLTLLETIYEKLNLESNKIPLGSTNHSHQQQISTQENTNELSPSSSQKNRSVEKQIQTKDEIKNHSHIHSSNKSNTNKTILNKFVEMNVDGNGSVSSGKSSIKRRAPTAPHISLNDKKNQHHPNNSNMFTLSSVDVNLTHKTDQDISKSTRFKSHGEKFSKQEINSKERISQDTAASCDDSGHIFVYDCNSNQTHNHNNQEQSTILPRKTERIQQWLSSCETKEELDMQKNLLILSKNTSPKSQLKMRCSIKPIRQQSSSPKHNHDKNLSTKINNDEFIEPGRFRSCLKIQLEKNESTTNYRSRASSATSKYNQQQKPIPDENLNVTDDDDDKYFEQNKLSPSFQYDHQAVYL
ncbi:unnamed protein product [Rotaria sordida]|uniref:Uncharacterized protein n=1 Tax=Rotaria sordida TaxID=392033 RepID=A0A813W7V5_9BILA|nr:unnamed protein product [Rotaria sordida]